MAARFARARAYKTLTLNRHSAISQCFEPLRFRSFAGASSPSVSRSTASRSFCSALDTRAPATIITGILGSGKVNCWLKRLVGEKGNDLYRIKGILSINKSTGRYIIQGVHFMLDGCCARPWSDDEKRMNKLVIIGRNLDGDALWTALRRCLV